jgi:hypothetical protein
MKNIILTISLACSVAGCYKNSGNTPATAAPKKKQRRKRRARRPLSLEMFYCLSLSPD